MGNLFKCDRCEMAYASSAGVTTWEDKVTGNFVSFDLCRNCLIEVKSCLLMQREEASDG